MSRFNRPGTEKEQAKTVFRSLQKDTSPVELTLGILPSGASYLLIEKLQVERICAVENLPHPLRDSYLSCEGFESLSPIYFADFDELATKLTRHAPKKGQGHETDTSQANRSFSNPSEEHYMLYLARAIFEQVRLLRMIVQNPKSNFEHYQVFDSSRLSNTKIISFAYTQWASDGRPWTERQNKPTAKHLDVGFAVAKDSNWRPMHDKAVHMYNSQNAMLAQRGEEKADFLPGTSVTVNPDTLRSRIQEVFAEHLQDTNPTVLLVYNQENALKVLQAYGVVTDSWQKNGLRDLLHPSRSHRTSYNDHSTSRPTQGYRRSSRSRSPQRNGGRPPRTRSPAPDVRRFPRGTVHVIDIQNLVTALFHGDEKSLNDVARKFDLPSSGWNAARDADTLVHIFRSMADGPSIDQQHELRARTLSQLHQPGPSTIPAPSSSTAPDDDDDDPNDIVQVSVNGQKRGYYSEDSDYEGDSD
ncbi:hypothetical protein K435DRAFT_959172 [Dendrothele bispora CBS 962.96]|uniref:Uncharacterized protein n=1 Tax=Dendrothele bispora (strain CBS 962.96) TaxID=1314807 RepID=A0A4S8N182_DENBC|nr:hypothetical protein K435DRAFT_959172 [Dendrothele bispora CBS 962.96]